MHANVDTMSGQSSPPKQISRKSESPQEAPAPKPAAPSVNAALVKETGGPSGPEPTRYGDWEHKGRCIDF